MVPKSSSQLGSEVQLQSAIASPALIAKGKPCTLVVSFPKSGYKASTTLLARRKAPGCELPCPRGLVEAVIHFIGSRTAGV